MELLGYEFRDEKLAKTALTTPACKNENRDLVDNQRLEFLGDSILNFLAAEQLYSAQPDEREGALSVRRTHMVSTVALCEAAERQGIDKQLARNRGAEELPRHSKTLADAVEAIIGAAYLDGGMEAARKVYEGLGVSANAEMGRWSENPKGELQELSQRLPSPTLPHYTVLSVTGTSNDPTFTVRVEVAGLGTAEASAHNRKEAESEAARKLLKEHQS